VNIASCPTSAAFATSARAIHHKEFTFMRFLTFTLFTALVLAAPLTVLAQGKSAPAADKSPALVNLNTATQAQLETLPGIGAKVAARIIEHRQKNGGFKKIEELMNVKGIGEKAFLKLKPQITVTAPKDTSGDPKR
jgi:comEA protein